MDLDAIQLSPMRELRQQPRPTHLVEGVLIKGSLAELVGRWGHGKTAIALDLGYRIANGEPWCDRMTLQGPVVYVAAEAADDLLLRSEAWDCANPGRERDVLILPREVNLFSPPSRLPGRPALPDSTMTKLCEQLDALPEPPVLVIFDTYAQCTVGSRENDAGDVGIVMGEVKRLMRRYGCAVLLLHHPPVARTHQRGRGSGALVGAADVSIWIERQGDTGTVTLECKKSRRLAPFPPVELELAPVTLADGSCSVIARARCPESSERAANARPSRPRRESQENEMRVAMVLFRFGALPPARLREAVPGMPRRTFFEVLKRLADRGVLTKSDDGAYDLHTELRAVLSRLAEEQLERTIKKDGEVWLVVRRSDWDRGTEAA